INDTVHFQDSVAGDTFYGLPSYSIMTGAGYLMESVGIATVDATSSSGNDTAILYDSAGNDSLQMSAGTVSQTGPGYSLTLHGFHTNYANATSGGIDTAQLTGSPNNDTYYGLSAYSVLMSLG